MDLDKDRDIQDEINETMDSLGAAGGYAINTLLGTFGQDEKEGDDREKYGKWFPSTAPPSSPTWRYSSESFSVFGRHWDRDELSKVAKSNYLRATNWITGPFGSIKLKDSERNFNLILSVEEA